MRPIAIILPVLLSSVLAIASPRAAQAQTLPDDPFLCYQAIPELYQATTSVHLADPFRNVVTNRAQLAKAGLCVPASASSAPIVDGATHLEGYRISTGPSLELSNVGVENLLGVQLIDIKKPYSLLVPTALDPSAPPPLPDPTVHRVDAYSCYRAKRSKGTPKLKVQITLRDAFTNPPKVFEVGKPVQFCASMGLNGERAETVGHFFTCYKIKPASGQPKHVRQYDLHVNNVFGPNTVYTKRERELCLPSFVDLPPPADPTTVAPPIPTDVATDFADATEFLYSGEEPIQTGVAPDTIARERAAVLRGVVFDAAGAPLAGVQIAILDHPEFGWTVSRGDGRFDHRGEWRRAPHRQLSEG